MAARANPPKAATVDQILDYYLQVQEHHNKPRLDWVRMMLVPIRSHFGPLQPHMIKPAYVRDYSKRRLEGRPPSPGKPISAASLARELTILRAALKRAENDQVIEKAPYIEVPSAKNARRRFLSVAEVESLIRAARSPITAPHVCLFVELALLTAQRGIAIKTLRWEHVDFENEVLWFEDTGGAANKRRVNLPMTPEARKVLTRARLVARTPWVIEYKDKPVVSLKTGWRGLTRRAGLKDANIHDLRRTVASRALKKGSGFEKIGILLGDTAEVVRKHYAHFSPDYLQGVIFDLEESDD